MPSMFLRWRPKGGGPPSPRAAAEPVPPLGRSAAAENCPAVTRTPRILALSAATREYARAVEAGFFDRLRHHDVTPLAEAMGICLWSWQRARRLTGQAPWRAGSSADERAERIRAWREMTADVATWQRALTAVDAAVDRALAYGGRVPEPLALPPEVRAIIEDRRKATLARATRKEGRQATGDPPDRPPDGAAHAPPATPRPRRAPRSRRPKDDASRAP